MYDFPSDVRLPNSDRVFLVLTFSGGGTRAAALSFGVLEQMTRDSICVDDNAKSVADEIDIISAVSGGSFTAAYFALHGSQGLPIFRERFLDYSAQTELGLRWFMPEKLLQILISPRYGRSEVAEELWDDRLFERRTFSDLARRGRPYVYINATDMDAGSVFSFTADQLGALCIRADTFPIARAVAASSAVPGALSPVTIRNHAAGAPCVPPPAWTASALQADPASDRYRYARTLLSYSGTNRKYVHLLDGGLADNIGARVPLRLLTTPGEKGSILDRLADGRIRTIMFVVVDAQRVLNAKSADIPFGNFSSETIRRLRDQAGAANVAEVTLRNVADSATQARLEKLGTTFELPRRDVDLLRTTGASLIAREQAYRSLLQSYEIGKCRH